MGVSFAEPPPRAAGLVQRICRLGSVARPNRAFSGTGALNVEKAITQPI
jgi:hypothetical protein